MRLPAVTSPCWQRCSKSMRCNSCVPLRLLLQAVSNEIDGPAVDARRDGKWSACTQVGRLAGGQAGYYMQVAEGTELGRALLLSG